MDEDAFRFGVNIFLCLVLPMMLYQKVQAKAED